MNPEDYIQDGTMVQYGADGSISQVVKLNPQQLATDESRDKVLEWLADNVPEGAPWTTADDHAAMTNSQTKYNCPCWKAVAKNGQEFNSGELYHNLFDYASPTPAVVDELHRMAG
jgi:hypothetical protein